MSKAKGSAPRSTRNTPQAVTARVSKVEAPKTNNTNQKPEQSKTVKAGPATQPTRPRRKVGEAKAGLNFGAQTRRNPDRDRASMIQQRLKMKSQWYASIKNPLGGGDAKIPDSNGTETGTLQTVQEVAVTVSAGGVAGLKVISPYPNSLAGGGASANYQYTNTTSTIGNVAWTSVDPLGDPLVCAPTLKTNTRAVRVVSAAVIAVPEVSRLADSGEMCGFVTPWKFTTTGDYAALVQNYDSSTVPVSEHIPMKASWYPTIITDSDGHTFNYQSFIDPNDTTLAPAAWWELGVVASGIDGTGSPVVKFKIIVNYEYIPLYNVIDLVDSAPSPSDEMEEKLVMNWIQELPATGIISKREAYSAPTLVTEHVPEHETAGLGMLFDVIKEVIPVASMMLGAL